MMRPSRPFRVLLLLAAAAACRTHDPKEELEVKDVETYWVVDSPKGATQYISPAVRFRLRNKGAEPIRSVQATANFKRVGEQENWGSAWEQVTQAGKPLAPGHEALVVLRSDGRYTSTTDAPESMFAHELFKDARVEVFVRIGSSNWVRMTEAAIERKIGAREARELGAP
ncbi:MAG TPA: hypothetical protein VIC87_03260 [Vicinamibacteria bacterium]|jgi:hypothetical protein